MTRDGAVIAALIALAGVLITAAVNLFIAFRTVSPATGPKSPTRTMGRLQGMSFGLMAASLVGMAALLISPSEAGSWFVRDHWRLIGAVIPGGLGLIVFSSIPPGKIGKSRGMWWRRTWLSRGKFLFGFVFLGGSALFGWDLFKWVELGQSAQLMSVALDAFGDHRYGLADAAANECIARFGSQAKRQQGSLANAPEPPEGRVSEAEKQEIFRNGLLNDVASCYWVRANSALARHDAAAAAEALAATCQLTRARTYDPRGWFWSPSKDACDRLNDLP